MRIRTISLNEFNSIANEPDVLTAINPTIERIDLEPIYSKSGVRVIGCADVNGCALLIPWPNSTYELHWFMPGNASVEACAAIVDYIFETTTTDYLFGATPKHNIAARIVNRWLGGKIVGELVDDYKRPCVTYALSREEWATRKATRGSGRNRGRRRRFLTERSGTL